MEPNRLHNSLLAAPMVRNTTSTRVFVWSVWLVMILIALACIAKCALGMLLFFITLVVFALAMGIGRAGLVPTVGMPIRYALLAVPIFCMAFFVWELYGSRQLRSVFQRGLFLAMCLLIPFNTMAGFQWRNWYVNGMQSVEQDLLALTPPTLLAKRHKDFLIHWWDENKLAAHMQMLHDAEIGPFAQMQEN